MFLAAAPLRSGPLSAVGSGTGIVSGTGSVSGAEPGSCGVSDPPGLFATVGASSLLLQPIAIKQINPVISNSVRAK